MKKVFLTAVALLMITSLTINAQEPKKETKKEDHKEKKEDHKDKKEDHKEKKEEKKENKEHKDHPKK